MFTDFHPGWDITDEVFEEDRDRASAVSNCDCDPWVDADTALKKSYSENAHLDFMEFAPLYSFTASK